MEGCDYISTSKVTPLSHEASNDSMELGTSISETKLASSKSTEVICCLGDNVVIKSKDNPPPGLN